MNESIKPSESSALVGLLNVFLLPPPKVFNVFDPSQIQVWILLLVERSRPLLSVNNILFDPA